MSWPDVSVASNASWPETPRQDGRDAHGGAPDHHRNGMDGPGMDGRMGDRGMDGRGMDGRGSGRRGEGAGRHGDGTDGGARDGSREPGRRDPVPAWQDASSVSAPSSPSDAWSNLSSPAPWPPADGGQVRASAAAAMDRTITYGRGTPLNDHAVPQGGGAPSNEHAVPPGAGMPPHDRAVPLGAPAAGLDDRATPQGHQGPQGHPGGPQGPHGGGPVDELVASQGRDRARPAGERPGPGHPAPTHPGGHPPAGPGQTGHAQHAPGQAPADDQHPGNPGFPGQQGRPDGQPRPGSNLSRDPSDPDRPFVTAGQISGSRTPPPQRQQELWDNVFGEDYDPMSEPESLDEPGKPIWIYALAGSVSIALVGALLWAFLAGPLAPGSGKEAAAAQTSAPPSTTPPPKNTRQSTSIGRLPRYPGKAAPVLGAVTDTEAGISVPRLGGTWQLDQRATVHGTYGFATRQYVKTGPETYAQIMTGPLPQTMASSFTSDKDLEPVIKAVVVDARKDFFPKGNTVRKIAQQPLKIGNSTGRLIAYSLTSPTEKATIAVIAVNSGKDVPSIVYMSVPATAKQLLPDVNTVVRQLKVLGR
ncbi:hypothetical protein HTZ77_04300 [Nonomuraea sp. SMC257]|uniref:Uncharacterized protein n=1 Tax=Nonomuraea montanisoli TaxID=2741721 RepID=A0A7Y6I2R5_9ACTN|nr:hypothetical protein [Nonomuraea montanisoli]NUW30645.1 hypothetical protein [Nonomuraea montanisoli]